MRTIIHLCIFVNDLSFKIFFDFRDKISFYEEKLSYYREMNEREKSSNRNCEGDQVDKTEQASENNENDLEDMGSTYRMLKIEIDMVNSALMNIHLN